MPQYANKKVAKTPSLSDSSMISKTRNYEDDDDAADSSTVGSKMTISNSRACVRACMRESGAGWAPVHGAVVRLRRRCGQREAWGPDAYSE